MAAEEMKRAREIVDEALRRDPEERHAFLDQACAGKPELREAVDALLAQAHESQGSTSVATRRTPSSSGDSARPAPQMIGPYLIRHEIARGGMGVVYLAEDTRLSRRVALKALPAMANADPSARERLRREARAAAALLHPGIATVFALEEIGEELFLASEYVPGQTLRSAISAGPLPVPQVLEVAVHIARALAAAHTQGIVHRDLKPENIVLGTTGQPKVLDFGIARVENLTSTRLTETGVIVGTPAYMAPEQAQGFDVDFRTDLFSFGVLLYEMATGANPFEARTATATIVRILEMDPRAPSSVRAGAPAGLDAIVERCLQKHPADRYATTEELVVELEALASGARGPRGPVRTAVRDAGPGSDDERYRDRSSGSRRLAGGSVHPWWETHQLVVIALYIGATAWCWRLGEWYRTTIPSWIFVAIGVGALFAGTIRAHLLFTERFNPARLAVERDRTSVPLTAIDLLLGALLIADGFFPLTLKPTLALLTICLGVSIALARLLIEPATASAMFDRQR